MPLDLLEHTEELRTPEEQFDCNLAKYFDDNGNETIKESISLCYCTHRTMVIYHKKHRADLKILSEKLILKLSMKERSDACELEKHFEHDKT